MRATAVAIVIGAAALAGCGSDESAQDRYCEAGNSLETSLSELANLDLIAGGTDGLNAAVDKVGDDLSELKDAASEAAADDVETLEQSVDALEDAISTLSGDLSSDNVASIATAIENVGSSAQAVRATLADC